MSTLARITLGRLVPPGTGGSVGGGVDPALPIGTALAVEIGDNAVSAHLGAADVVATLTADSIQAQVDGRGVAAEITTITVKAEIPC